MTLTFGSPLNLLLQLSSYVIKLPSTQKQQPRGSLYSTLSLWQPNPKSAKSGDPTPWIPDAVTQNPGLVYCMSMTNNPENVDHVWSENLLVKK